MNCNLIKIYIISTIITYIYNNYNINNNKERYNKWINFLKWGKENGLIIHPNITLNFTSPFNEYFIASDDIKINDTIILIPNKTFIDFDFVYNYTNKKFKNFYKKIDIGDISSHNKTKNQIYLALIIQLEMLKQKGKLYKKFKPFLDFNYPESYDYLKNPSFYTTDEWKIFSTSTCSLFAFNARQGLASENFYLQNNIKKDLDSDQYFIIRIINEKIKRYDNESIFLVPFINLFKFDPFDNNCFELYENNSIKVIASRDIKKGEIINLIPKLFDNCDNLLYYGYTFDYSKVNDYNPKLYINVNLDKRMNMLAISNAEYVDYGSNDYFEKTLEIYNKTWKNDVPIIQKIGIIQQIINKYLQQLNVIKTEDYNKKIFTKENKINIQRIIEEEKKVLNLRKKEMENKFNYYKKYNKRNNNIKNEL